MADTIGKFPTVPVGLLEALERIYQDRCPPLDWPERDIWARVGAVNVVRLLRREFEKQNKSVIAKE